MESRLASKASRRLLYYSKKYTQLYAKNGRGWDCWSVPVETNLKLLEFYQFFLRFETLYQLIEQNKAKFRGEKKGLQKNWRLFNRKELEFHLNWANLLDWSGRGKILLLYRGFWM